MKKLLLALVITSASCIFAAQEFDDADLLESSGEARAFRSSGAEYAAVGLVNQKQKEIDKKGLLAYIKLNHAGVVKKATAQDKSYVVDEIVNQVKFRSLDGEGRVQPLIAKAEIDEVVYQQACRWGVSLK